MADKERRAADIIALAAHSAENCVLFFSGGKDSVAVLALLQKVYPQDKINLVFMPFVDGLVETGLVTKIAGSLGFPVHLYQHWIYFAGKSRGIYCAPEGKPKRLADIYAEVRSDFGADTPIFYGAKRSDGMWRRLVTGKGKERRGVYAPIYEWSKYDVLSYIRRNRLDYLKQEGDRVSGVDLSDKYLVWAYENQRQSYEAIKKEFPFVDVVIKRHEFFKGSWKAKDGSGPAYVQNRAV
jgi:3'-phosphoadenosine 5'-phosphosulfate sulfotransferase (PAPS reductase)/FAD synthetase